MVVYSGGACMLANSWLARWGPVGIWLSRSVGGRMETAPCIIGLVSMTRRRPNHVRLAGAGCCNFRLGEQLVAEEGQQGKTTEPCERYRRKPL